MTHLTLPIPAITLSCVISSLRARAGLAALTLFAAGAITAMPASRDPGSGLPPEDELQSWIEKKAVAVRSIAAADEDFSDLEPLVDAIGPARVVQLGEPGHGAGSSFAAKVRLIKFLHQRMGFDVVIWESGLHGLRGTQAGLRGGEDAMMAAQRGVFTIWSKAEELRPLFEYAQATQARVRPLEMAGFDLQFTVDGALERFTADLRLFVGALNEAGLRERAVALVDRMIEAHSQIQGRREKRQHVSVEAGKAGKSGDEVAKALENWEAEDASEFRRVFRDLNDSTDELLALLRSRPADVSAIHSRLESGWMTRAIENLRADAADLYIRMGPDRPKGRTASAAGVDEQNHRESVNANNLRWLIQDAYAGRKVVIWAHNAHVMNAYYAGDWRRVYIDPPEPSMKPSGMFLTKWLGTEVYTILMTTYEGEDRWVMANSGTTVPPASADSLESRLHRLGKPYLFLDFRSAGSDPDHPLRSPVSMRLPKFDTNTLTGMHQVCDAVFYIDRMAPATPLRDRSSASKEITAGSTK